MYKAQFRKSAEKDLASLPKKMQQKILDAAYDLEEDPRPSGSIKLSGTKEPVYRIRVGDYRVIYSIEDAIKIIEIQKIGHRKDVYRL